MASLADLFNPTFMMFLGILVLVVALLVVYFESKIREQNHKIASMLSLVSTLADDLTGVKMGLNHLAIRSGQGFQIPINENLGGSQIIPSNNLIEVSDDDQSEEEEEELEEEEEELEEDEEDNIKVIKLRVSNENDEDNGTVYNDEIEDLADSDINDELPDITDGYVEQVLDLKYDDIDHEKKEPLENLSNELKTISINLGDEKQPLEESIEYKKLQLAKLRSIAVEKGLTSNSEVSKLKKPEILKLLGAE